MSPKAGDDDFKAHQGKLLAKKVEINSKSLSSNKFEISIAISS